ncbi:gtp-binding protein rho5 [Anaeramoeba flamelloides]|uniref:Gtp-binding protein rho5 n=1 Tax=Anaeramoeba flamelloides TaxID=1746091 RepID=A0ABQ8XDT7_9EUKA|nr:gtp-binding protein rho5 [Anaeramoeba flamelloides]
MKNVKFVQVGDGGVGKTCYFTRYARNSFPTEYIPTIFDGYSTNFTHKNQTVNVGFWDTAGQEDYDRLRPLSYPETDIFMVSFDVSNRDSFENVRSKWEPEIRLHCPNAPMLLVGLKTDLRDDQQTREIFKQENKFFVSPEEGKVMSSQIGACGYTECSALNGEGVKEVLEIALDILFMADRKKTKKKKKKSGWFGKKTQSECFDTVTALEKNKSSLSLQQDFVSLLSIDTTDPNEIRNWNYYGADVQFFWNDLSESDLSSSEMTTSSSSGIEIKNGAVANSEDESQPQQENKQNKEDQVNSIDDQKHMQKKKPKKQNQRQKQNDITHCVNAHKFILMAKSPIFQLLFEKKITKKAREIGLKYMGEHRFQITGISFSAFVRFLKYIYCEKIEMLLSLSADELFDLEQLSDSFQMPNLKKVIKLTLENFQTQDENEITKNTNKTKEIYYTEGKQLQDIVSNYYDNNKNNDLEIIFQNPNNHKKTGPSVFTSKSLLIARTKYFKKFFNEQQEQEEKQQKGGEGKKKKKKKKNNTRSKFILTKFNHRIFTDFLFFLRSNKIVFKNYDHLMQLLKISVLLGQESLNIVCQISICEKFMEELSTSKLALLYLKLKKMNLIDLSELCLNLLAYQSHKTLNTKVYKKKFSKEDQELFSNMQTTKGKFQQKYRLFQRAIVNKSDIFKYKYAWM